jgi:putative membrane protein
MSASSPLRAPRILNRGEVAPTAVRYQVLTHAAALFFLFPLYPILLSIVHFYYRRYYATLEVVLTTRELQVNRGILIRQEKSIPLEQITDLAVFQGPIMRHMGLKGLQVETAGQSGAGSALVKIVGLANTDDFRDAALDQRDKVTDRITEAAPAETSPSAQLEQIHQTLLRIESRLGQSARDGT